MDNTYLPTWNSFQEMTSQTSHSMTFNSIMYKKYSLVVHTTEHFLDLLYMANTYLSTWNIFREISGHWSFNSIVCKQYSLVVKWDRKTSNFHIWSYGKHRECRWFACGKLVSPLILFPP
ncbi:uncharacterized protein LOC135394049 isoform X2 [Ornithodoros turicata]|uniref:uncharacterized protein LOC135394049 isoform X2 n=1 Tax=Ornithodoros turicata TaxID=34597 RepID=UPI00313A23CA